MSAERLYTPQMLSAAVELANVPPLEDPQLSGSSHSATCGSTLDMGLSLDDDRRIALIGMRVRACAVGQAAAAIFARHAAGCDADDIKTALTSFAAWLEKDGSQPAWPDIELIAAARDYPGRHGAMLLPWKAAIAALSSRGEAS